MKKDGLFWGTVIAFGSFFLMVVFFMVDSWKAARVAKQTEAMKQVAVASSPALVRDFSRYPTSAGNDGAEMILIPGGPYQMGSSPSGGDSDEMPQHAVYLSPYFIDAREVTQSQFSIFARATGHPLPVVPVFEEEMSVITRPELPVVGVSWSGAKAYCEWAGRRLPTEAEWEKAAGGEESLRWPWGHEPLEKTANLRGEEDGAKYLAAPGQFPAGRSPYGAYDMSGNAAEWVADWYDADYYKNAPFKNPKGPEKGKFRVYRGGSWNESNVNARTAKRFTAAPHQTSAVIGVRCAADGPPEKAPGD